MFLSINFFYIFSQAPKTFWNQKFLDPKSFVDLQNHNFFGTINFFLDPIFVCYATTFKFSNSV